MALKDAPATAFRTPPAMRLYRVNPSTGLSAAAGGPAIYEAYKTGTEPGSNRSLGMQPVPGEEGVPVASRREEARDPTWTTLPTHTVPASGTGGLY